MNAPVEQNSLPSYNHFVFFHPYTNGSTGRAVYIDPNLLRRFLDLLGDPSKSPEQTKTVIVNGIFELRNAAGGITADSNTKNAFEHRHVFGDVMVVYRVLQSGTENSHGAGVYITQLLRASGRGDSKPAGLYQVTQKSDIYAPWDVKLSAAKKVTTPMAAVGAKFKDGAYTLDATINEIGDNLLKFGTWKNSNTYSLYYAPSYIVDQLGTWKSAEQKVHDLDASPEDLANILINTQQQHWAPTEEQKKHKWYIFDDGIKILSLALDKVKKQGNTNLSMNEFYFINPNGNIGLLFSSLNDLGASVFNKGSTLGTNGTKDLAVQVHQANNLVALADGYKQYQIQSPDLQTNLSPLADKIQECKNAFSANPLTTTFSDMIKSISTVAAS